MFCKSAIILTTEDYNPKLIQHDWPEYLDSPFIFFTAPIIKVNQASLFVIFASVKSLGTWKEVKEKGLIYNP